MIGTFNGSKELIIFSGREEVTLTSNNWQGIGLTNGYKGVVRGIVYEDNQTTNNLPIF